MPNSKRMNRKLHRAGQLIRQDLEPRLQRLEAENEKLRLKLNQPPAESTPAEPAPAPEAQAELRLLRELTELAAKRTGEPTGSPSKASHAIQPSGGGLPAPDLRAEYERRVAALRPGDVAGLMEVKREFRKRGMEIY